MMAAVQPFLSGAISKTVNVPEETTADEIERLYIEGWKLGLKAVAVYRDNCKGSQPLSAARRETSRGGRASSRRAASCPTSAWRSPTSSPSRGRKAT